MQTSTGEIASYERWARASFDVDGAPASITIYRAGHTLFLPFQDATSSGDSYGAGRYLEPEETHDGRMMLDFNYA